MMQTEQNKKDGATLLADSEWYAVLCRAMEVGACLCGGSAGESD